MAVRIDDRDVDLEATAERLVDIATELLTVARRLRDRGRDRDSAGPPPDPGGLDPGGLDPDGSVEELIEPRQGEGADA